MKIKLRLLFLAPSVNEETVIDEMIEAMSDVNSLRNPKDTMSRSMYVPSEGSSSRARNSMAATISSASALFNDRHVDDDGFCIIEEDLGVGIAVRLNQETLTIRYVSLRTGLFL